MSFKSKAFAASFAVVALGAIVSGSAFAQSAGGRGGGGGEAGGPSGGDPAAEMIHAQARGRVPNVVYGGRGRADLPPACAATSQNRSRSDLPACSNL